MNCRDEESSLQFRMTLANGRSPFTVVPDSLAMSEQDDHPWSLCEMFLDMIGTQWPEDLGP